MDEIGVKDAVKRAKAVVIDLYEDDPPRELALEEIDRTTDGGRDIWLVTLGFFRRKSINPISPSNGNILSQVLPASPVENRDYKTVHVDAKTGEFVKMDMRRVS